VKPPSAAEILDLPDAIKPAADLSVYLTVPADGVQIYVARKNDAGAIAWAFKGPEAKLFYAQGKQIGTHYAGPTWDGNDGGKVVGAMKASAPSPSGNAIPWLLIDIKSTAGEGQFTRAKAILRVETSGGTMPSEPPAAEGAEVRVPYTATYLFLK
jgi:hypothetical protein